VAQGEEEAGGPPGDPVEEEFRKWKEPGRCRTYPVRTRELTVDDDELRARLRAADPARGRTDSRPLFLPEADMNTTGPSRGPSRGRVALIAAAAAVVVLAGVGIAFSVGGDDEPARTTAGQKAESPSP